MSSSGDDSCLFEIAISFQTASGSRASALVNISSQGGFVAPGDAVIVVIFAPARDCFLYSLRFEFF